VRNRLLVSVALCSLAVLGAGTPGILESSETLTESQDLVEQAGLHQQAIVLAHSLSDERAEMVEYVASGRTDDESAGATATTDSQRARVDRQITEILATGAVDSPVRQSLEELPELRRETLTGDGTAFDTFQAYTAVVQQLHGISRSVARGLPGDADAGSTAAAAVATTESLPHLGRAVGQASATRGLLRGAFAGDGAQGTLTEAAVQARLREQAALADFEQTAGTAAAETFAKTVTGTDVGLAERYIEQLTADGVLGPSDRALKSERVLSALSARIDRMRSVQSSLATAEVARLEAQRDDDVVALELRIALVGACLLLAVGVSVHTARSLARPLSVLRRGSKRLASAEEPDTEEPVRFHGRNDEFAEVVRSLNEMRETAAELHTRAREAEADNAFLVGTKDELTAERERLGAECDRLRERLDAAQGALHGAFVHLGLRTLGLVERQLGILEALEAEESDPDELATLFKLDHLATRMRRAGENLLLLAGAEHGGAHHTGPVPLLDVLRAAVSEIERYERVQIASLPPHAQVSGFAADDVSHLVAELLDNATSFSAPDSEVTLSAWMLENGEVMLSVQDDGIGVAGDRLTELNTRLRDPAAQDAPGADGFAEEEGLGNGLYVVARLAARHALRVQLREQKQGGIAAVVVLPRAVLPDRPVPGAAGPAAAAGSGQSLPGSVAEANSNTLPVRRKPAEPARPAEPPRPAATPDGAAPGEAAPEDTVQADAADAADAADDRESQAVDVPEQRAAGEHARADDETGSDVREEADEADEAGGGRVLTEKGLPKRTPRHVASEAPAAPRGGGGAKADELRRRLGGFQRGARDGHRDAAAETAPEGAPGRGGTHEEAQQ
jgi:signal transduction histidine kinase